MKRSGVASKVLLTDPKNKEESTGPKPGIAWVSLRFPTRRSAVLLGSETSRTTGRQQHLSLKRRQPRGDSIEHELTRPINGLCHTEPRRRKATVFSAGDGDRSDYGSGTSADTVKDSDSQTSFIASGAGDRNVFTMPPLVKEDVVGVTPIINPPSEESGKKPQVSRRNQGRFFLL